ncbi:24363_t:CDS:2 [Dentiscutata erythropus]|uniref:24363_t:CDS:1 n=1 Tax=Dentiscutata erythropus TaxID=1348616 RepID=A0A9N8VKX2_9GLOM|nr:24363_t:CDS:2 [Dentiscutata erythropus]
MNMPGETNEELEFEDSSNKEYEDTGYNYYNLQLGSNYYWWNTNEDEEAYPKFTANLEDPEWSQELDKYINWDYNNF